ncbi:MAG: trimethylamine methyltransferase family protein [Planctomycetota bacterium]
MKRITFGLNRALEDSDLEAVHAQVLKVLDRVGLGVSHRRSRLAAAEHAGVREDGERVYFAPELIQTYVERARREHPAGPHAEEVTVSGPWNCLNIVETETGRIRPSRLADCRRMMKLIHVTNAGPICPVYPNDVEAPLQVLALEKASVELSDGDGSHLEFNDPEMLEFAIRMYAAAGRTYHAEVQFPISPLRTNRNGLETIWRYRDRQDLHLTAAAAPIPQAGATAPLFLPGALVQAAAEAIGCYVLVRLIAGDRVECLPQLRLDLFDLKSAVTTYSSPTHILYQLALADLYEFYYGIPKPGHFLQSMAKTCDAQAVLERTAWMLTLALAGFRRFCLGAGQLSMDEVFSPVMFVIDREIARFVTHVIDGVEYDETPDASFEAIREGVAEGNYFTHEATLRNMRQDFDSDILPRMNLDGWRRAGARTVRERAKVRVRELIDSHQFALSTEVQRDVDRIYEEAVERIGQR